jgi:hypothetical protein
VAVLPVTPASMRQRLSTDLLSFPRLWITLWTDPAERGYFHWVETTNPAAMKPKPTTMFQLPRDLTGMSPVVT